MTSILGIAASASTMRFASSLQIPLLLCLTAVSSKASLLEESNMRNRGAQTFGDAARIEELLNDSNTSTTELVSITTSKPLTPSYTVIDWRKFYPFGGKFNETNENGEKKMIYPVYVKIPIRVPVKAGDTAKKYTRYEKRSPSKYVPRTVRGAYHPRHTPPSPPPRPRARSVPLRRKYIPYYRPTTLLRNGRKYLGSKYHTTGIHDLYKMNVYYPLRGRGYEVTERTGNYSGYWGDPATRTRSPNLLR